MPQAMKIPVAKAAVKKWETLEEILAWQLIKVRNKKDVIDEARNEGRIVHFASLTDLCHLKKSELEHRFQKYKGRVVLRGDIVKQWFWFVCSVHWTRIFSVPNDSRKSHGHKIQIARVHRTSSGCSTCLYPGQNGRCTNIIENSKVRMSRYLDTSTEAQMAQIMVQYGRPSRSSRKDFVRSSSGRTDMGKTIQGSSFWNTVGKSFKLGMFICQPRKRTILVCVCGRYKLAGKAENLGPTWKILMKDVDPEEPTSFLDHVYLGCTQRECTINCEIETNYRDMFESRISAGAKEKLPTWASGKPDTEIISSRSYDVEKVMQRNVWKYIANLRIKRLNNYTKSQRHAWMTINLKKKKMSQWENCPQFAHKSSEISVFGSYWETWHIMVCE